MKVIINLSREHVINSIEEGQEYHNEYRDMSGLGGSSLYDGIVLDDNNNEIGYISYNGRYWEWDDKDNPYTNGSTSCEKYKFYKKQDIMTNREKLAEVLSMYHWESEALNGNIVKLDNIKKQFSKLSDDDLMGYAYSIINSIM